MLTGDENIVEADCAVFWKIRDAGQFLFRVNAPEAAVKIAAEGALREVISRTPIQAAMSDKRQQIADQTRELLQSLLDSEQAGIQITQVQLQRVEPPLAVIDAFNDVQRARADQERARNEAEAYSNDILPRARGEAERIRQDAEAYKTQVVNLAQGEANAFLSVYGSYQAAKEVTAWRLYLESVDEVLKKATKVIVDTSGKGVSSVVPYMPVSELRSPAVFAALGRRRLREAPNDLARAALVVLALVARRPSCWPPRSMSWAKANRRCWCASARRSASPRSRASRSRRRSSTACSSTTPACCFSSRRPNR